MLADHPLDTVLLVTDLDNAHRFYHQHSGSRPSSATSTASSSLPAAPNSLSR